MPNKLDDNIEKLRARDPKVDVTFNAERTAISILRGKIAAPVKLENLKKKPFATARLFIRENKNLLGVEDEVAQLEDKRVLASPKGTTHVVFCQKHGNARVLGAGLSIHYKQDGSVYLVKNDLATKIELPKTPKITAAQASEVAKKHVGANSIVPKDAAPVLSVVNAKVLHLEGMQKTQKYFLAWQLGVVSPPENRRMDWIYFVDALDGKVLFRYPAIQTRESLNVS